MAKYSDLIEYSFGYGKGKMRITFHPGKAPRKTAKLVKHVLQYRDNFHFGIGDKYPNVIPSDVDTNCYVVPERDIPLSPGIRIFDLACIYAGNTIVEAMLSHPDTPVGEIYGWSEGGHTALTFMAEHITCRSWADQKPRDIDQNVTHMRKMIFKALI